MTKPDLTSSKDTFPPVYPVVVKVFFKKFSLPIAFAERSYIYFVATSKIDASFYFMLDSKAVWV